MCRALLEKDYAAYVGSRYCLGLASCGSAISVALKSAGVVPGDKILCNAFTLAPVPGAIENAGALPVFVEITKDYVTDFIDLEEKAQQSGARYILLSHMRGHIVDMDRIVEIKWFGAREPVAFTSSWESWQYIQERQELPQTRETLDFMCDFRIPLTFSMEDCALLAAVIRQ